MAKRKAAGVHGELKAEAVWLVRESGKSVPTVARELDCAEHRRSLRVAPAKLALRER